MAKYTRNTYTSDRDSANVSSRKKNPELAKVVWEGDTHDVLCGFPDGPRGTLGHYLYLVQKGEAPPNSSPVPGLSGVFELRDEDERAWYRILHLKRIGNRIHVLHCFEKESNKISKPDIETARIRLKRVQARLREEERSAKRDRQSTRYDGERSR